MKSSISIVRCNNYQSFLVQEATSKAIDLIGGIETYIRPKSKVLVKPNLLMAKEPEYGITTHPEVVRAVVRLLKKIDCNIFIGDGPSVWGNYIEDEDQVYEKTGMAQIAAKENIELVKFIKRRWRGKFPLTTWLDDCDYLISIPKFKTHGLTILTAAIKNLFGLVPGKYKLELHRKYFQEEDFAKILVDIYQEAKPTLTVIDAIMAMEGEGPGSSGQLRNRGLLLAGCDCAALDSILALIMGLKSNDILTNKEASGRGVGVTDVNAIQIKGEGLKDIINEPAKLPTTSLSRYRYIPKFIINIAKKLIRFYPKVNDNNCVLCGACLGACPEKIITIKNERILINYSKCISCFCCQECCPNAAISIKRSIVAQLLRI